MYGPCKTCIAWFVTEPDELAIGLRGVPETIREAAIAYGASKWYLLRKVDLPLATPSILAGVNQTVMLSLAMVVVASLIGAKGKAKGKEKGSGKGIITLLIGITL